MEKRWIRDTWKLMWRGGIKTHGNWCGKAERWNQDTWKLLWNGKEVDS